MHCGVFPCVPCAVEPTTGTQLFTDDENYLGMEFIWNSKNLWVNMQKCVNGLKDMDYDLKDTTSWEYMVGCLVACLFPHFLVSLSTSPGLV